MRATAFFAAVAAACSLAGSCLAAPEDVFAGTTKIVFTNDLAKDPDKKSAEITDKDEIAKVLATLKLKEQVPAACDHVLHAAFTTPKGVTTVNLCRRCFDFGGKSYAMTAEFYALFEAAFRK